MNLDKEGFYYNLFFTQSQVLDANSRGIKIFLIDILSYPTHFLQFTQFTSVYYLEADLPSGSVSQRSCRFTYFFLLIFCVFTRARCFLGGNEQKR
jgi:hypothetical protein